MPCGTLVCQYIGSSLALNNGKLPGYVYACTGPRRKAYNYRPIVAPGGTDVRSKRGRGGVRSRVPDPLKGAQESHFPANLLPQLGLAGGILAKHSASSAIGAELTLCPRRNGSRTCCMYVGPRCRNPARP